jgi:ribonucleoside-diphosphate reductase subunit M1
MPQQHRREPTGIFKEQTAPAAQAAAEAESDAMLAKMAEEDPDLAEALNKLKERHLEEAKMYCALENKEACLMCSG